MRRLQVARVCRFRERLSEPMTWDDFVSDEQVETIQSVMLHFSHENIRMPIPSQYKIKVALL